MAPADSHYFDQDPQVTSDPRAVEVWLPDLHLTLTTDRGVFGYDQVDPGTKALLLRVPPPTGSCLVDLGCGAGLIAVTMARRAPQATVWAVDVNRRALDLCAANAAANGVTNVRVSTPDDVPDELTVDTLWSNPPIRIGKPALHQMLTVWFGRLAPGGEAWMVVHKHLGADSLQRWLGEHHYPTTRAASTSGYRILHTLHPDSG